MKRRDLLKSLGLSSLGLVGLSPQVQAAENILYSGPDKKKKKQPWEPYGRTEDEEAYNAKLLVEQFFNPKEMETLGVFVDIIIPKDQHSGSATDAGVPDFIEFMAKDRPNLQTPLRGGLHWIDSQATKRFGQVFTKCSDAQRLEIVEDIAYPNRKNPGMSQGVAFFSLMRNLTASGFWSSQMGLADMGYQGNTPNQWDGVPEEVLKQYGLDKE
ncbi:MAG: gluconate 2-dehydrogenase subunit 3 family protein [Lewinellaceae bacterium]|nr:gluconate 2-dehydrogenase subunit 3 family protein [Lewinellaceae bacterium]